MPPKKTTTDETPENEESNPVEDAPEGGADEQEPANDGGEAETPEPETFTAEDVADIREQAREDGWNAAMREMGEAQTDASVVEGEDRAKLTMAALAAVILRLPRNLRVGGVAPRMLELQEFINEFPDELDRYMASELVKAIAESRIENISNGLYKVEVREAMRVIHGEPDVVPDMESHRKEQEKALAQLQSVVRSNPVPSGFNAEPKEDSPAAKADPELSGDPEKDEAAELLYKGNAAQEPPQN